ncbi:MAG: hypothetical protein H6739_40280 [Alphaproteobacteria bacterium]|nr:hypothetical protein [Alphaproteobacteria bacterium]
MSDSSTSTGPINPPTEVDTTKKPGDGLAGDSHEHDPVKPSDDKPASGSGN